MGDSFKRIAEMEANERTMFDRLERILDIVADLGPSDMEDLDALLEAVRVERSCVPGPTTRASAKLMLEAWRGR